MSKGWNFKYSYRSINGRWAEWEIAHSDLCRIEGAAGQRPYAALQLAHPALGSYLLVSPVLPNAMYNS